MFEGMPWPVVIPIAILVMVYSVTLSNREEKVAIVKRIKQLKKQKSKLKSNGLK